MRTLLAVGLLTLLTACVALSEERAAISDPHPNPVMRIDLSSAGYEPGSRTARLDYEGNVTLNFVDANHFLLTFNPKQLLVRLPDCPSDHDDWLARAVIVEIPTGRVVRSVDWYLHDRHRYLWSLGHGEFLLRKLNSLYLIDGNFKEKPLFASPKSLVWASVTPDGKEVILETEVEKAPPRYQVQFLDIETLAVKRSFFVKNLFAVQGTSTGYVDALHSNDIWLIRFGPTPDQRINLARVHSRQAPQVFYPSDNSLVIARCAIPCTQYAASAFTVSGRRLWRQHWDQARYFPTVIRSDDNSRFGVSTLHLAALSKPGNASTDEDDVSDNVEGLAQTVQVLETASGTPILTLDITPSVKSGQNAALSSDGLHLAVLHGSTVEIYDLPMPTDEERALFTALKADAPGLYVPASAPETDAVAEAPTQALPPLTPSGTTELTGAAAVPAAALAKTTVNEPGGSSEPLTTFRVASRTVLVDVVVTDSSGHPVKGLSASDFSITEDSKPQDVRSFREVSADQPAPATPAPTAKTKAPPNVFTNSAPGPEPGAVTLVVLDLLNTPVTDQSYARQQLINFLKARKPDTQFALCLLTPGRGATLQLLQGFTSDENTLMAAINRKSSSPQQAGWQASGISSREALTSFVKIAQNNPRNDSSAILSGMESMVAQAQAAETDQRVDITMDVLTHIARYLGGLPGRKNLVWLSGSFPMAISPGAAMDLHIAEHRNYSARVKQMTNLLAEAQIAVYPVDVRGLQSNGNSAVENNFSGPGQRTVSAANPGRTGSPSSGRGAEDGTPSLDQILQMARDQQGSQPNERSTMEQFAKDTGGQAFFNTNAIDKAIGAATEQGLNYYSISYSPTNKNYNGKFRKIRVELARKGYHLHYRQGYYADEAGGAITAGGTFAGLGAAAMQHGSPLAHQIHFAVRVIPIGNKTRMLASGAKPAGKKAKNQSASSPFEVEVQRYAIDYAVDRSDVRFVAQSNQTVRMALGVDVASYSDDGRRLNSISGLWSKDLNTTELRDASIGGLRMHEEVDVPTPAASLRLGVEDQVNKHLGTIELPLPVPAPPDVPKRTKHSLPEVEPD